MNHLTRQVEHKNVSTNMTTAASDNDLISYIINNNEEVFTELYNRYNTTITQYVANKFRKAHFLCSADVDEVVQTIWIDVHRLIKDQYMSEHKSFKGLLFTMSKNQTAMYYRRKKMINDITPSFEDCKEFCEQYGSIKNVEAPYDEGLQIEKLYKLLNNLAHDGKTLSDHQRDAYVLKVLKGFTTEETQKQLGLSEVGLKSRLHKARIRIIKALRFMEIEELRDIM